MYKDTPFSIESIDQIEKDLQEAKRTYGLLTRIFLVNGDAFVLKATTLKEIAEKIIQYFPEMETISMYASIRNIKHKTDEELLELRALRINDLWVGLESGNDEVISHLNKGYTLQDAHEQLIRLNKADIRHNGIFMLGAAGRGKGIQNAIDTAKLINETKPSLVGVTTLGFFEGSDLSKEVENNTFTPATELEILEEEKELIQRIDVENIPFYGSHPINAAYVVGILPNDKEEMVKTIDDSIKASDEAFLNSSAIRSSL
jgi:coproporphyrinogen III oxidase-like Fe-S oxidoreductase